jgi:adenosylmethionine-8-amino-7-oxononanoate aminotransferase
MLIAPPFILTEGEADLLLARTRAALDATLEDVRKMGHP